VQTLSHDAYLALRARATVVERDLHGEKVLRLEDGNYLKLFRRKRLISSAAWYPYAQRFADNAIALKERGIPCPEVVGVYRIKSIQRDAVLYSPLSGNTLRELILAGKATTGLRTQLADFIARLHEYGIYFRSLHLGNIVLTPEATFGLIDIADLHAGRSPVPPWRRRRNLQHLLRCREDHAWLHAPGVPAFAATYSAVSQK
jgi:tRNA A-37 threonylcarbamoyl transferase component Bud32